MAYRRLAWLLFAVILVIPGCGGGSHSNVNDPNSTSYLNLLEPTYIRWTTTTIPVAIDTTNVPSDWNPAYLGYVGEAYGRWLQNLMHVKVKFYIFPQDTDQPKVKVRWVNRVTNSSDPNAISLTKLIVDPSDKRKLLGFDIQIGLRNLDDRRLTDQEVLVATVHEIGHALGMMCHSPNEYDVMYAKAFNASPTARDLNTVEKLYSLSPVITDRHALVLAGISADNR